MATVILSSEEMAIVKMMRQMNKPAKPAKKLTFAERIEKHKLNPIFR